MTTSPDVAGFFDDGTNTISYVLADPASKQCAVIDPVWDYDGRSGKTSTASVQQIESHIVENEYTLIATLETHAHADHLSGAQYLKERFGAPVLIGEHIIAVQKIFKDVFNLDIAEDGSQFDRLLVDEDVVQIGELDIRAMHTPGHTPACMTYVCGDAAFVGDTLFMPDYGSARTDFPGGDAATLFKSVQKILALPEATRLFLCHDYLPDQGRTEYQWETNVATQRGENVHVHRGVSEDDFVTLREQRDATLAAPALLLPSVQVNIRAGRLPDPESNGVSYLKIPVK